MATINGTENGDTLIDVAGNDTITAGDGDDTITVTNGGTDTVDGGGGSDRLVLDARTLGGTVTMNAPTQNADGLSGAATWSGTSVSFQRIEHFTIFTHNSNVHDFVTTGGGDDVFHHAPQNFSTYLHDEVTLGAGTDTLAADFTGITYGSVTIVIQSAGANGQNGVLVVGGNGKVVFNGVDRFAITGTDLGDTVTAGGGNDSLNGGLGNDTINGGAGDDDLDGGAGADTVNGGAGNDTLRASSGSTDNYDGGADVDTLIVDYSASTTSARSSNPTPGLNGNLGDGSGLRSISWSNIEKFDITTGSGNDNFATGNGDDRVVLNGGDDFVDVGAGNDVADGGEGIDGLSANLSEATGAISFNLRTGQYSGPIGSFTNFEYVGTLTTGSGDDTIVTDTFLTRPDAPSNTLVQTINTGAGDDSITVSGGDDRVNGGDGIDTLVVQYGEATGNITNGSGGTSGGMGDGSGLRTNSYQNIERFHITTGSGNDRIATLGSAADRVVLGAGNDFADVTGNDTADGGAGDDGISVDLSAATSAIVFNAVTGQYSGPSGSFTNFEYFGTLKTGSGNDVIVTSRFAFNPMASSNVLQETVDAGAGDDSITVFNGVDTVAGGLGFDTLIVDYADATTSFSNSSGSDGSIGDGTGTRRVGYSGIERFIITTGAGNDMLNGGTGDDEIRAGAGNDTASGGGGSDRLDGGLGADTINGQDGDDTLIVTGGTTSADTPSEQAHGGTGNDHLILDYSAMTAQIGLYIATADGNGFVDIPDGTNKLSFTSIERITATGGSAGDNLTGVAGDDVLNGAGGNDFLSGGGGKDLLDGGSGNDDMRGGGGDDVYVVDSFGDTVTEQAGEGTDEVRTALGSRTNFAQLYALAANVEKLTGTSIGDQGVRDNALNNTIVMGVGNDLVAADQGGEDVVDGGAGDDFLFFGDKWSAGDQAIGGAGYDGLGLSGGGTYMFEAGDLSSIEQLALYAGPAGSGPFIYNVATADANVAAGERLFVNAFSLGSADTLVFDGSAELDGRFTILGGAGIDSLTGGQKGDYVDGRSGDDILYGLDGNDTLIGGLGADTLIGGNGRDTLLYTLAAESTGVTFDTIVGFDYRVDRIDLHSSVSGWTGDIQTGTLTTANFDSDLAAAVDDALLANSAVLYQPDEGDYVGRAFVVIDADGDGVYKQGVDYVFEIIDPVVPLVPTTEFFA